MEKWIAENAELKDFIGKNDNYECKNMNKKKIKMRLNILLKNVLQNTMNDFKFDLVLNNSQWGFFDLLWRKMH